jgi:hypothetical protein
MNPPNEPEKVDPYELAKSAIHHVLNAICDDPRKFWLMGHGTGSYEKLTAAAAAIWDKPVEKVREDYQPNKEQYRVYCDRIKEEERLLDHCRDNGITVERDEDDD